MTTRIFYHKVTGTPVQIIARAETKPTFQEVICYQELESPYEYYVMERRQFFDEYVKEFAELPVKEKVSIGKRDDLPDKRPLISKGEVMRDREDEEGEESGEMSPLIAFLDAGTYREKMKILEEMRDELDESTLNSMAVSLDLSIEDGADAYGMILSELQIRQKYELNRGE